MLRSGIPRSYSNSTFSFARNFHSVLHSDYQLTSLPAVYEGSVFSTPSLAFVICRLLNDGHSDPCEVVGASLYF